VYAIIVFRSRTETMKFSQLLRSYGVRNSVINTPRQASVSCGISVKVELKYVDTARNILLRRRFDSYGGIYRIYEGSGGVVVEPF